MTQTLNIARRELSSQFFSPIAYAVLGIFALGTSLIFVIGYLGPGQPAALRGTFEWVVWLMIFLVPAISMRLISEELRSGTVELLMTAPITDADVVVGKWLGALGFFSTLLLPLLALAVVLEFNASPDWGPIVSGLIGLVLVAGLYLAIGTFASALTENQIIAFFVSVFVILPITLVPIFVPRWTHLPPAVSKTILYLQINAQYEPFGKGLLALPNVIYFVSGIALFLFLAVKTLESRRWR